MVQWQIGNRYKPDLDGPFLIRSLMDKRQVAIEMQMKGKMRRAIRKAFLLRSSSFGLDFMRVERIDKDNHIENQVQTDEVKSSSGISSEEKVDAQKEPDTEKGILKNDSTEDQAVATCAESSGLDESDLQQGRPASPGTIALMCYEQDTELMEPGSPRKPTGDSQNVAPESSRQQNLTECFAEQERMVLTKFRDFLNRLITCGSIKETMCSQTRSETGTQSQPLSSAAFRDGHLSNGVVKPLVPVVNHAPPRTAGVRFGSSNGFTQNIGLPAQNGLLKPKIEKTV